MTDIAVAERRDLHGAEEIAAALDRIATQIRDLHGADDTLALVGIQRRGVPLAERLRRALAPDQPDRIPLGQLDITLYRDDLSSLGPQPIVGPTELPFDVDGRTVVLVDDVLFTGRTVRAALEALIAYGRPRTVRFVVLVDRGHREYPIQPDAVGIKIPTTHAQSVEVRLRETDDEERVVLVTPPQEEASP